MSRERNLLYSLGEMMLKYSLFHLQVKMYSNQEFLFQETELFFPVCVET